MGSKYGKKNYMQSGCSGPSMQTPVICWHVSTQNIPRQLEHGPSVALLLPVLGGGDAPCFDRVIEPLEHVASSAQGL